MKAIALVSGGLDSILAAKLVKEQGIEVVPVNFKIPFCHRTNAFTSRVAAFLNTPLTTIDISGEFLEMLSRPRHGFGSNMNPCIDCKILMFRKAKELMLSSGAECIVTGEVLGQRPMSQHRRALDIIEKESGLEGILLRPLSAQLLPETVAEKEGKVSRSSLLNFSGRQRRPQMGLAEQWGLNDYAQPSGGCLLTDPEFTKRLKELIEHNEMGLGSIELLKVGRHFRLAPGLKLVVGRNQKENAGIQALAQKGDYLVMPDETLAGPTALARGALDQETGRLACAITARYCDLKSEDVTLLCQKIPGEIKAIRTMALGQEQVDRYRI
jgi:tRNA-uridine 2-sulfurtransferase